MLSSMEMFKQKWREKKYVCVGLDSKLEKLPMHINVRYGGVGPKIKNFNSEIILATRDVACAYKYNLGFYLGMQRLWALEESVRFSKTSAPDVPVILDWKAGDIGSTLEEYASYAFEELGVDAVTVNPWGGRKDGIDSFLKYNDKGIFVWCDGSNEGSGEFQNLITFPADFNLDGGLLEARNIGVYNFTDQLRTLKRYSVIMAERVAATVSRGWNTELNCGVVVGATRPANLLKIRKLVGDLPILIPGIGEQKGDLESSVKAAIYIDSATSVETFPAIVNSSRSIIYASNGIDFAEAARDKTIELNNKILEILKREGVRSQSKPFTLSL